MAIRKTFTVVQIYKEDQFIFIQPQNMQEEYEAAWELLCAACQKEGVTVPMRPRRDEPVSIELPYSFVQIWAVSIPDTTE